MKTEKLAGLSASAIARHLSAGEGDPVELAECYLDRIATDDDQSVFIAVTPERARAEAEAARRRLKAGRPASPLDGVPIAWKDLVDMAGSRTTAGSDTLRDSAVRTEDAPCLAATVAAGMVTIGKTNLTEFAYSGIGQNPHFGTPRNPNGEGAARSPGGSSSGSGVAVASGLVPCAIGTDTGGSVRIPAAFNGVVGYKSTAGRIDKTGVFALSETLDTVGPLARSVEDCVHLDAALRGVPVSGITRADLSALHLVVPQTVVLDDLDPAVAENFEHAMDVLSRAGVRVERRKEPAFDTFMRLTAEHGTIIAGEAYQVHHAIVDGPLGERIDRRVAARILGGKGMSSRDIITLVTERKRLIADVTERLDGALFAYPTTPHIAPELAPLEADDDLFHTTNLKTLRNTTVGNFLDLCGLALPNGFGDGSMPTSVLISAPGGDDERLLSFGLSIEREMAGAI